MFKEISLYTPCVERAVSFGHQLSAVLARHKLKAIDVARLAFEGEGVDATTIRNFASYIGRIQGGSQNPRLDVLDRLARGCGLTRAAFFQELERREKDSDDPEMTQSGAIKTVYKEDENPASTPQSIEASSHGGSAPLLAPGSPAWFADLLLGISHLTGNAATALKRRGEPPASAGAPRPPRGKMSAGVDRRLSERSRRVVGTRKK